MTREELRREFALKLKFTTSSTRITQLLLEYDRKLQELSLPPAEGAEEILDNKFDETGYDLDSIQRAFVLSAMQEFATLHAQRIADKMVSERLREELEAFLESIRAYERESHNLVGFDERESREFVEIYLKSRE